MRYLTLTLLAFFTTSVSADTYHLDGYWQLNLPESDKVAVKYKEGSGSGRRNLMQGATVSIGGLPLPTINTRVGPASSLAPKNPEVLLCNLMAISSEGDRLTLTYDNDEQEKMRRGDYRGRKTEWGKKGIKQTYKTPDRKVTKSWSIREDGRLLVEVKLNPRGDRSRTYRRVFDRVDPDALPQEDQPDATPAATESS